jgi:hypothetical protein
MALSVQDDGVGMARSNLHCMLSFGFSSKEHVVGNVGRFGIGFKSGSMRIAHDALILSRREGQASAALLSTTFLNAIEADDILIPMFTWTTETGGGAGKHTYVASEPSNTAEWEENMSVIEQYTYLASEAAVLRELDKITTPTGTRIVLFNLKDPPEFDFSVKNDVRMLGIDPDEQNRTSARRPVYQQHRPGQQMTLDVPEDYSLRAYMEVLYLRPTVTFSLRGELIEPRCPISRLALEYYKFEDYTPKDLPEERRAPIAVHCGYQEEKSKHCGFHIYNKNRLIRMYQRFGAQLQANAMMKDMLGVVEADCLEPTHNKQAFNTTDVAYQKCQKHLEKCMNDYYFGVQNLRLAGIGAGGKRRIGAPQGGTRKKGKSAGKDGKGTKGKGQGEEERIRRRLGRRRRVGGKTRQVRRRRQKQVGSAHVFPARPAQTYVAQELLGVQRAGGRGVLGRPGLLRDHQDPDGLRHDRHQAGRRRVPHRGERARPAEIRRRRPAGVLQRLDVQHARPPGVRVRAGGGAHLRDGARQGCRRRGRLEPQGGERPRHVRPGAGEGEARRRARGG